VLTYFYFDTFLLNFVFLTYIFDCQIVQKHKTWGEILFLQS